MDPSISEHMRMGGRFRIGTAEPPSIVSEARFTWPGIELQVSTQDISRSTDWQVHEPRHTVIVHLGGRMDSLQTELDGHGGSFGPATPGEVWTVPADASYSSHATGHTIRFAVLSLSPAEWPGHVKTGDGQPQIVPAAGVRDDWLLHAVKELTRAATNRDDISRMQAESLSNVVASHVITTYGSSGQRPGLAECLMLASHEVRLLREFIFDNLATPLTLDAMAGLVGLSTHQLLVSFRSSFGTTPAQYVITQRLRRTQWHLLHTDLDISSIALKTGFNTHSHLTTVFTKRFGYPPQQFRTKYTESVLESNWPVDCSGSETEAAKRIARPVTA